MNFFSCYLLWFFYYTQLTNGCKQMIFKITNSGQALVNHTFHSTHATSDGHCEILCFIDDRCISFNYGRGTSGETHTCELNEADHKVFPDDLLPRTDTIYRMAETTCNCSKSEICRPDYELQNHRCICKQGFTLENCGTSFRLVNCNGYKDGRSGVYELDGTGPQAKYSICRIILNANADADSLPTQPYRISVDLYSSRPDGSDVMHPGIGFNIKDQDNFDYLLFRTHSYDSCIMPGRIRNNIGSNLPQSCPQGPPPHDQWFQVAIEVRSASANVFVNGIFMTEFSPSFPLRQKGAVAVVNGYKNIVRFRNLTINQL